MIRDITIGQYYPTQRSTVPEHPAPSGSAGEACGNAALPDLPVPFQQHPRLSGGHALSHIRHPHVESAVFLYHEGHEAHHHAAYDHGNLQSLSHKRRGGALSCLDLYHYCGRTANRRVYGDPPCLPDRRVLPHDIHHYAQCPDGTVLRAFSAR